MARTLTVALPLLEVAVSGLGATELPSSMRAAVVAYKSPDRNFHLEQVKVMDFPVPKPGTGEVLIEVHVSNVNPVDHKIVEMAGWLWSYPHRLGYDVAGVVAGVGPGCERLKIGDQVWASAATLAEAVSTSGTFAQYAAVAEWAVGVIPRSLPMVEAGAMPMVSLTGLDSLTWAGVGSRPNMTVLVLGGSGGTGHIGIQIAKALGAGRIITTCSSSHADFVRGLGADQVIDYHAQNWYDVLGAESVDVVYDCVGEAGTGDQALNVLSHGGHFATLLTGGMPSLISRVRRPDLHFKAPLCVGDCVRFEHIDVVASMVTAGKLRVHVDTAYGLEDIAQAFNESLGGHTTGKVALLVKNRTAAPALLHV